MTRRPLLDLPLALLILPPVLFGLGLMAVEWIDLPQMPWSPR